MLSKKSSSRARNIYLKTIYCIKYNMNNYNCEICNLIYKTRNGLFKHNKKYHPDDEVQTLKNYLCQYCNKGYNSRQSRWMHEQKCKITNENKKTLEEQVKILNEKVHILEQKPNTVTNNTTNNNITNNTNIQYVINAPTSSSITHLTFENQKQILNKGLNSLTYLIENVNFNKSVPENHSYCVTAINDKHASVIDEKTNTIVKTNKFDLFDKVLGANLANLEKIASNPKFTQDEKVEYASKIEYLKKTIFQNSKFIKRYQSDINLMGYNNKDMVQETWKLLKPVDEKQEQLKGFDDLIDELPDEEKPDWLKSNNAKTKQTNLQQIKQKIIDFSDSDDSTLSSDSDSENEEIPDAIVIEIKGKSYIVKGTNVYDKITGAYYGIYSNGKIKKIPQNKDIDV